MNDESGATNQRDDSPDSRPAIQAPQVNNPIATAQPQPEHYFQHIKDELTGYERSTLRWTRVIVVVNVLTWLFIALQWYEMKSGSKDTHTLADAAKTQADKCRM